MRNQQSIFKLCLQTNLSIEKVKVSLSNRHILLEF
jgi:hypothetical protein